MAISLAAGVGDYLQRTSGFLTPASSSTVMQWVQFGVVPVAPAYTLAYALLDDPAVYTQYITVDANSVTSLELGGTGPLSVPYGAPSVGVWYHIAWVQSGTAQRFYVNGVLIGTFTLNRAAFTIGFEMLGNDTFASGNLKASYFRSWQTALTQIEIANEMMSATVVKTASLFMNTPLVSDLLDISGNGHHWTQIGSGSFVAGPTFPANNQAATATVIASLPFDDTQNVISEGVTFTVWYKYTAVSGDNVLGVWGFGDISVYKPETWIYSGPDASTLTLFGSNSATPNRPMILPVSAAQTYWFKFVPNTGNPAPASLAISVLNHDDVDVPDGSLAVNYDSGDLPLALFSSSTGQLVLSYVQGIVAGANGDILDDGTLLLGDSTSGNLVLYDANYTVIAAVTTTATRISCNRTDTFYVSTAGSGMTTAVATTVSNTGVLGGTSWALAVNGVSGLAPSPDETILYFTASTASAVHRFDLIGNAPLSDLTALPNPPTGDLICLLDGSVIVPIPASDEIRHYSDAGVLLDTYTATGLTVSDRLCRGLTEDTFWWWANASTTTPPVFREIEVSGGAVINTIAQTYYEAAIYGGTTTATPTSRFGISSSCPVWVTRSVFVPPTPGPGEPEEFLIRRERWFPVINQENQRMTFSMLQVDLQAGNGLTVGQGENPLLELDWSDDSGWTWSNIRFLPTGRLGQYNRRAIARVLGQSRQRVFRIAVSDPVQWVILDGYMQVRQGSS